jgi:DMSO reductase anchor subunit
MKFLFITAVLGAAIIPAWAQVASHTTAMSPTAANVVVPTSVTPGSSLQVTGKTVAIINGSVLTDRDLLREMYTMFPYAQATQRVSEGPRSGDPARRAEDDRI